MMYYLLRKSDYLPSVRAAQDLAGLLKQSCPEVRSMVDALQEVVTKSHAKLDAISGQLEEAERVSERGVTVGITCCRCRTSMKSNMP